MSIDSHTSSSSSSSSSASDSPQTFDEIKSREVSKHPKEKIKLNTTLVANAINFNNNGLPTNPENLIFTGDTKTFFRSHEEIQLIGTLSLNGIPVNPDQKSPAYYDPTTKRLYCDSESANSRDEVIAEVIKESCALITVCDGCGKFNGAADAAISAAHYGQESTKECLKKKFTSVIESIRKKISKPSITSDKIISALFKSVISAQENLNILKKGYDTTYIQVAVVGSKIFGISIGDSKAFVFSPLEREGNHNEWRCRDLTPNPRRTLNKRDPGGFLRCNRPSPGSDIFSGSDIQTMHLFSDTLFPGEVLFVCSDGVSDNFDPEEEGAQPSDVNLEVSGNSWKTLSLDEQRNEETIKKCEAYARERLAATVTGAKNGQEILEKIRDDIQKKVRTVLQKMLSATDLSDLSSLPGKPDDAAMAFVERTS